MKRLSPKKTLKFFITQDSNIYENIEYTVLQFYFLSKLNYFAYHKHQPKTAKILRLLNGVIVIY